MSLGCMFLSLAYKYKMEYQVIDFNGDRVAHAVGEIIAVKYELAKAIPPVEVSLLTGYAHFI